MSHDEAMREKVFLLLDGALPDAGRAEVSAHLESCPDCREALGSAEAAGRLLRAEPLPAPSERFVASVMARLPEAAEDYFPSPWWWAPAFGAAFAAALLLFDPARPPAVSMEGLIASAGPRAAEFEAAHQDGASGLEETLGLEVSE